MGRVQYSTVHHKGAVIKNYLGGWYWYFFFLPLKHISKRQSLEPPLNDCYLFKQHFHLWWVYSLSRENEGMCLSIFIITWTGGWGGGELLFLDSSLSNIFGSSKRGVAQR